MYIYDDVYIFFVTSPFLNRFHRLPDEEKRGLTEGKAKALVKASRDRQG